MNIKLSKEISVDLDKLIESRMLIQANSGGGKSWASRRFIEQTFGKKQIIIIDPEGEYGNLRKEYDFVYIAKEGGDAPAEVRSAALLARRLLETKANAIIDIYELGSQKNEFIRAFMHAMVNMPKELWTDCFVLLDEAHKAAPEKGQGESVALQSVIDMASLGRKRGYCLIPCTQRPAKLSKDVVAECNNKLIGRASLDIDRDRSAKELGFRKPEDVLSLRDLQPGEFYAFGPAISPLIVKTVIGDVKVKPPKRGEGRKQKIAPPTEKVKKWLKELADLPQEAEKEARTVAELRTENASLKRELSNQKVREVPTAPTQAQLDEALQPHLVALATERNAWGLQLENWHEWGMKIQDYLSQLSVEIGSAAKQKMPAMKPGATYSGKMPETFTGKVGDKLGIELPTAVAVPKAMEQAAREIVGESPLAKPLTGAAVRMLAVLASRHPTMLTRKQLGFLSDIQASSGSFRNYLSTMRTSGFITENGNRVGITELGLENADRSLPVPQTVEEVQAMWRRKLTGAGSRMFDVLIRNYPQSLTREELALASDIDPASGSFRNYLSTLRTNDLIEEMGKEVKASEEIMHI